MKKQNSHFLIRFVLIIGLIAFSAGNIVAQVSTRVEEVSGVAYYMHEVTKGQTLYSLSKLYQCDINDITAANPGSDSGIKLKTVVRIPVKKSNVKGHSVTADNGRKFLMHEVARKETLFSIANQYNIDINDLIAANPESEKGVKKGQTLRIPIKLEKPKEIPLDRHAHTVLQGETLFGIAKQYHVKVEDIQNVNDGLKSGLLAGEIILIPANIGPSEVDPGKTGSSIRPLNIKGPVFEENYDIALMLPFYVNYNDTMESRENMMRDVALQIYRGAMMAIDSLQSEGLRATLHVYDILDSKSMVTEVLAKPEMKNMDLVIGPIFRETLTEVCNWGAIAGTHVVSPVQQPNRILLSSPNMSKAVPATATQWIGVARHIYSKNPKANLIVVDSKNIDDRRSIDAFREEWLKLSGDSVKNVVVVADPATFSVKEKFVSGKKNIVIAPTSDKKVIGTLFRVLGEGDIEVYGNENWDDMDAINVANRNRYHVHYPQTTYVDYNNPDVQRWIDSYRKAYKSEPGKYSFVGYDVMKYYGMGLKQFGRAFPNHFGEIKTGLYANGFDFLKTSNESGFENQYVIIIGTSEFELIREN